MTRKVFVLIDQSIKDHGGHYFEYAERVLNAAKAKGFDTLLLTHRDFADATATEHDVRPIFRRTFWENFSPFLPGLDIARKVRATASVLRSRMRRKKRNIVLKLTYTRWGYVMLWAWDAVRASPSAPVFNLTGLAVDTSRPMALMARLFWRVYFALRDNRVLKRARRLAAAVVVWPIKAIVVAMGLGIALLMAMRISFRLGPQLARSPVSLFKSDLERAFAGIDPATLAYVFVPTLHTVELEGIRRFLEQTPLFQRARWGLLYRRNILSGRPHEFDGQLESLRPLKVALDRCRRSVPKAQIDWLTDTDELTDQYDRLGIYKFRTVPVPSDFTLERRRALRDGRGSPLTLAYLGDARDEKGFAFLPDLQRALYHDYIEPGRARLLLQANYNIPGGEPGSRCAHVLLRDCHREGVELVYGPFDREQYQKLIAHTDVMLIPYDDRNYAARSSGILSEAIAAGIPSVIPGGTWMASVLEPHRQGHLARVFPASSAGGLDLQLSTGAAPARFVDSIRLPTDRVRNGLFVELPANTRYAVLRVELERLEDAFLKGWFVSLNRGGTPVATLEQLTKAREGGTRIAFPVLGPRAWIKLQVQSKIFAVDEVSIRLEAFDAPAPVPLSVGAAIYSGGSAGFIRAVGEVLDHYPHFRDSAELLSLEMRNLYDPGMLVDALVSPSSPSSRPVVTARPREAMLAEASS